jgi:tetratricopeptide (TPR) repeat protein
LCKNLLADILIQDHQYQAAEQVLKQLTAQRLLIKAGVNLGKVYYLQKKYFDAIRLLKEIIDHSPLQIEAYRWLARCYQECGELDEALTTLGLAADMTHHSIERHQEVALLANEMQEYDIMLSSYAAILQLSRHSFYPDPCHLANYIRCLIDYAKEQEDINERKSILKKVNSTLYQSRFEEGQNKDFDFNNFDEICQAKVLFTLDQPFKAKRKILNTLHGKECPITEFDNTILCESTFSLLDIGEFEYATPYLLELKQRNILDPTTQAVIKRQTGKLLESRIQSFKAENKLGIQAFIEKSYKNALEHFNRALKLEPLNSGALLNRLQVYIQQLKLSSTAERAEVLTHCQTSFDLLNNTHLPEEHKKRYHELKKEMTEANRH